MHNLFPDDELPLDWAYWWVIIIGLLVFVPCANAQYTPTHATITDQDGTVWFGAKVTATFVPNSNYPNANQYNIAGIPITSSTYSNLLQQTVQSDGSGRFDIQLLDNTQIQPGGSSWKFVIQSYTSAPSATFPNIAVSGGGTDLTAFINANITVPRFSATAGQYGGSYGYGTGEVSVIPVPGGSFFNVTAGVLDVWSCSGVTPCVWVTQAVGNFCSVINCNIQNLTTQQLNNTCEASTQTGSDFEAQINSCASQSYMSTGGMITAYGYGNSTQTGTTALTALANLNKTQPIALILNPATTFIYNNTGCTTNSSSCVLVPIGEGSSITTIGLAGFTKSNFQLGPNATTYDFVANSTWDKTQEAFKIDGLQLQGNTSAVMNGSLLHIENTYAGTQINNVSTFIPHGTALTVDSGGEIQFNNDNFSDGAASGQYPGSLVVLNCPGETNFFGGIINDNGHFNSLLVMNSSQGPGPGCVGGAAQPNGVHFYGTYFETQAASVGTFAGHQTDVTPVQINDPTNVTFDGVFVFGLRNPAYQVNYVKINSISGLRGPIEFDMLSLGMPTWGTADVIIQNNGGLNTYVAPSLRSVHGKENSGEAVTVGQYKWEGSGGGTGLEGSYDYLDYQNVASATDNLLNVPPLTFSGLIFCGSGTNEGQIATISDSPATAPGTIVTVGGGSGHVQLYCNGTNWAVSGGTTARISQGFTICASGCTYNITMCTTNGSQAWVDGGCALGTFNWPIPFADNNYGWACTVLANLGAGGQPTAGFIYNTGGSNKGPTGIGIGVMWSTAIAFAPTEVDCVGSHN